MSQGQNPYGNPYPPEGGYPGYSPQQFGGYAGQPGGYPVPPRMFLFQTYQFYLLNFLHM